MAGKRSTDFGIDRATRIEELQRIIPFYLGRMGFFYLSMLTNGLIIPKPNKSIKITEVPIIPDSKYKGRVEQPIGQNHRVIIGLSNQEAKGHYGDTQGY